MRGRTAHSMSHGVFMALLLTMFPAVALYASPVTITQYFGPATDQMYVNSTLQTVTGDWTYKIVTDTANPDLDPFDDRSGLFAATITVSNSGLGLTDMLVTSYDCYWEWLEPGWAGSGITSCSPNGGTSLSRIDDPNLIGDPNVIEPSYLDFIAQEADFAFYNNAPLVLDNGWTIISADPNSKQPQTLMASGYQTTAAVPEPSSLSLMIATIVLVGFGGLKQNQKGQQ